MKKLLLSGICILLTVIFAAFAAGAAKEMPIKIGIIDTQKIVRDAKAAKDAGIALEKDLQAKRATFEAKSKEVRNTEEELKKADIKTSAAEIREKLAKEVKELNRLKSDLEEEWKKKQIELTQRIIGEIKQIAQKYSKSEGYTLIMEKGSVVTFSDSIDITDKIIKLYDDQKK
jgi:outer membrane protein